MPRAKPSAWRRPVLDTVRVKHLYPPEVLDPILAVLGTMSEQRRAEATRSILDIAFVLNHAMVDRARPTPAQQRAALAPLLARLAAVLDAVEQVDQVAGDAVSRAAAQDDRRDNDPPPTLNLDPGPWRIEATLQAINDFERWTATAIDELPEGETGRPRLEAERVAVAALASLWRKVKVPRMLDNPSNRPPKGPFLAFVRAALGPVQAARGEQHELEGIVEEQLYGAGSRE